MLKLPLWLRTTIPELQCPHCSYFMDNTGVVSLGIRVSSSDPDENVLFFEYKCQKCSKKSIVELNDMTLNEFAQCMANDLVENNTSFNRDKRKKRKKSSLIKRNKDKNYRSESIRSWKVSDEEVKEFKQYLKSDVNSDDFSMKLGLSLEDIEEFSTYKKNKKSGKRDKNE